MSRVSSKSEHSTLATNGLLLENEWSSKICITFHRLIYSLKITYKEMVSYFFPLEVVLYFSSGTALCLLRWALFLSGFYGLSVLTPLCIIVSILTYHHQFWGGVLGFEHFWVSKSLILFFKFHLFFFVFKDVAMKTWKYPCGLYLWLTGHFHQTNPVLS